MKILLLAAAFTLTSPIPTFAMSKKPQQQPAKTSGEKPADSDRVWVGKSDEAKSCAKEKGIDIDVPAGQLTGANIQILAKKKLHDGKMRIQMCGADKGDMNGFLISKKDLERAQSLGFVHVNGVPDSSD